MRADNTDIYKFPLTREHEPLSIIEQCHSMLRARFPTEALEENTLTNTSADAAGDAIPNRKFITLEAIMRYLDDGVQWKPLSLDRNSSASTHVSRQEIIRVLKDFSRDMPLSILHDSRFVSLDSHFCPATNTVSPTRKQQITAQNEASTPINIKGTLLNPKISNNNVLVFDAHGMSARTLGSIEELCPCEAQDASDVASAQCRISSSICTIRLSVDFLDTVSGKTFDDFFPLCASFVSSSAVLATQQSYPMSGIPYVRQLLREQGRFLKQAHFVCTTYYPSDLWGIKPSHFANADYLHGNLSMGPLHLSALHVMLHPRSGVSLLNSRTVRDQINEVLGEDDREVLFLEYFVRTHADCPHCI